MAPGLTSSSRASSLIRIFFILEDGPRAGKDPPRSLLGPRVSRKAAG
jgi:hypothetical protein